MPYMGFWEPTCCCCALCVKRCWCEFISEEGWGLVVVVTLTDPVCMKRNAAGRKRRKKKEGDANIENGLPVSFPSFFSLLRLFRSLFFFLLRRFFLLQRLPPFLFSFLLRFFCLVQGVWSAPVVRLLGPERYSAPTSM